MGIIIDGIIVLFVLISTFFGYKKGLVSLGINLVAFIITFIVVMVFYRPLGTFVIENTQIDETVQGIIEQNIEKMVETNETSALLGNLVESAKQGALSQTSRAFAENVIYGAVMLALFIFVRICLIFVTALTNIVAKLPLLKQCNELGGTIYGLFRGLLIVYVVLMLINIVITMSSNGYLKELIDSTYITKLMIKNNILNVFFKM